MSAPRSVAYVTMAFPVASETFATNDVRELHGRGVRVTVHALRPPSPDVQRLIVQRGLTGVPVTHATPASFLRGLAAFVTRHAVASDLTTFVLRRCWRAPRQLSKSLALLPRSLDVFVRLERDRPDVVHAYWSHLPSMVLYLVQRHMPEVVTSISFGAYDVEQRHRLSTPVARAADVVRTLARVNLPVLRLHNGLGPRAIQLIHDGIDTSLLRHDLLRDDVDREPHRIVTAGRLIRAKGMHHVLRAFAQVRTAWTGATLVVLGEGPERAALETLAAELDIADATSFRGHVSQREVATEMARADVFLFLSQHAAERLPNVVKEAMASRCVCVVSRTPGIVDLVEDGRTGFVVDAEDVAAAAARLDAVFAGRVDRDAIVAAAATHVAAAFTLVGTVDRYLACWSEAAEHRAGALGNRVAVDAEILEPASLEAQAPRDESRQHDRPSGGALR